MCGLTGFLNASRDQSADQMRAIAGRMADTLHHRGPDDTGIWCDPAAGFALGFKRLSIVDLSQAGHQPMASSCGRFVIAYNGEVYNHHELRKELIAKGHAFRGHSDTEVLIEGFAEWGIDAALQRTVGMFAIAVWDMQQRELTLARDRLGKKPLYYWLSGSILLFGSETKALRAHPAFVAEIDRTAIGEFLKYSYLPGTQSIYRNVVSLEPGHRATFPLDQFGRGTPLETRPYWSFREVMDAGLNHPFSGSYEQAVEQLDSLLTDAVGCRMLADVPLGAFLSGGIDSSAVVALMQKQSSRPVKTFTIGFEEQAYNEAPYARNVAEHLRTDHTELYVTSAQARDVIPLLPKLFDEPFADSSQIPTFLVSQLARRHVTVALSGDGGDELFCGYRRYFEALEGFLPTDEISGQATTPLGRVSQVAFLSRQLPSFVRRSAAGLWSIAGTILPGRLSRAAWLASQIFSDDGPNYRYLRNLNHWHDEDARELGIVMSDSRESVQRLSDWLGQPPTTAAQFQQVWQAFDTLTYLPGDILTKVDRASMGVSLEARTPLLDHRVVEFAWTLPQEFKVQGRTGKRILRDVLAKYVPRELFERPKVGFGVPIDAWLRGPLRDWAEDLLDEQRLKREGYLNPAPIRRKWHEHLSGKVDWHYHLWDVLMFQAWLAEYEVMSSTSPRK